MQCNNNQIRAILTIIFLILILVFIHLATGIHIMYGHKHDLKKKSSSTTGYEPIISQTTTKAIEDLTETNTNHKTTVNTLLQENPVDEQDESTPLISQLQRTTNSMTTNLISHCSLINNYILLKRFVFVFCSLIVDFPKKRFCLLLLL